MLWKSLFFSLFSLSFLFGAEDIRGFWKTINEEGVAQCIIAVYEHEEVYYGRIIGSFDDDGEMRDSIYHPVKKAPGVIGNPPYSGLDIIFNLIDSGSKFKGRILDPEKGNVYKAELWIDGENLIVRGKLFVFGRSQEWLPALDADFPKDFKKPDLKAMVPKIPEVN